MTSFYRKSFFGTWKPIGKAAYLKLVRTDDHPPLAAVEDSASRQKTCVWKLCPSDGWLELWDGNRRVYAVSKGAYGGHWIRARKWAEEHGYDITNAP